MMQSILQLSNIAIWLVVAFNAHTVGDKNTVFMACVVVAVTGVWFVMDGLRGETER